LAAANTQTQTLAKELAETKTKLAETRNLLTATAATPASEEDNPELGAVQSKLNTALSSYTLLQDENDRLKTATEQLTTRINQLEGQLAMANTASEDLSNQLDTTSATAARAAALREQLRQTADQLNTSRREAADLRTRIAIITPPPASTYAAPTRPGSAAAASVIAEAAPLPPAAVTAPRTHTVVAGDTLSGIALRYYGESVRWAEIYEANRAKLPNERALRIGMELAIP
jgi:nucleoid-associated protein YgaU